MTINPRTKAVELTPAEIRKAIAAHLKGKFNINCDPESISLVSADEGHGVAAAEVFKWDNTTDEEDIFKVHQ